MDDGPQLCVVTHPLSTAGETAAYSLLCILVEVTSTLSLVTARLPADSDIREEFDLIEMDAGSDLKERTILRDLFGFVRNQVGMCLSIYRVDSDAVLFYGATSYVLPIFVSRLLGKRTLLEPRGDVPLTLKIVWSEQVLEPVARLLAGTVWALERIGYALATDIVLYTPSMQEQLELERYDKKTHLHGARYVDTDRFHPDGDFEDRELGVGYLGRLDEEKGIRELTEAAALLAKEGIAFTFVGDGDLSEYVERRLDGYIAEGTVELAGWVDHDEVPSHLRRFRLLVMASSPTEGLPMTALESMACGTPVCAPPVAGLPDILREGDTGIVLDELSGDAIAKRVEVAVKEENLSEMSQRCVELIQEEFTFERAVERYGNIFDCETRREQL